MHCLPAEQKALELRLHQRIIEDLSRKRFPSLNELEIEVDWDRVTVRGIVNSYHERQVAISILANIPSVRIIDDQIVVSN